MRLTKFITAVMVMLIGCTACEAKESSYAALAAAIQNLDTLSQRRDVRGLIGFLAEVEGKPWWSFGGGVGPVDRDWLQMRVVGVLCDIAASKNASGGIPEDTAAQPPLSSGEQPWMDMLTTRQVDVPRLRLLLVDPRPAVRLLALRKLHEADKVVLHELRGELGRIAADDPYVVIERRGGGPRPPVAGPASATAAGNVLVAPLRPVAGALLGHDGTERQDSLAAAAMQRLAADHAADPSRRTDIVDAVRLLNPGDAARIVAASLASKEKMDVATRQLSKELAEAQAERDGR